MGTSSDKKEIYCKYCGKKINAKTTLQGFSVVCPHCKRPL